MQNKKEEALQQLDILSSNASAQKVSDTPSVQMQHVAGIVAIYQNLRSIILKVPDDEWDEEKKSDDEATEGGERETKPAPDDKEAEDGGGEGDQENT